MGGVLGQAGDIMALMPPKKRICLISDSTGELGERFINALITQFPDDKLSIDKHNFIQTVTEAKKTIEGIRHPSGNTILFHTVLSKELKKAIETQCKKHAIASFDLTGPPTQFMIDHLKVSPVWDIESIHRIDDAYDKRIDAIEFTIAHDDGAGQGDILKADAILVGPSRVSKTPTSIYLALKGFRIANIPLIEELGEPQGLSKLKNNKKVFGLNIDPLILRDFRLKRAVQMGSEPANYVDSRVVGKEILWARRLYEKYGWKTIDVSNRAIEETAAHIMKEIGRAGKPGL